MTYTYDDDTRLLDVFTTKNAKGETLLQYDYNFDTLGNITSITDAVNGSMKSEQKYTYDENNRLIKAEGLYTPTGSTYNRSFEFDDENRMTKKIFEDGSTYTFEYLPNTHAMSKINITGAKSGTISLSYDAFGNMVEKLYSGTDDDTKTQTYTYDIDNRLSSVTGDGFTTNFIYDNKGQRIKKIYEDNAAVIKETTYVTAFYTVSEGLINKHISDGNYIIATKIENKSERIQYYHSNHIGSTAMLTDNTGDKTQEYLYYPYGETWVVEDTTQDEITRLFTGQEYDKETGLYYYNARYYDPHISIFTRPDPMMEGLNHYAYANWNPIRYNDPTGLSVGSAGATSSNSGGSTGSTASCSGMATGTGIGGPSASNTSASNASQDGMGVSRPPNWWRPNDLNQGRTTEQQKAKANESVKNVDQNNKSNDNKERIFDMNDYKDSLIVEYKKKKEDNFNIIIKESGRIFNLIKESTGERKYLDFKKLMVKTEIIKQIEKDFDVKKSNVIKCAPFIFDSGIAPEESEVGDRLSTYLIIESDNKHRARITTISIIITKNDRNSIDKFFRVMFLRDFGK